MFVSAFGIRLLKATYSNHLVCFVHLVSEAVVVEEVSDHVQSCDIRITLLYSQLHC